MEMDSEFEDSSTADVDVPAPEDDTETSGAVSYDEGAGDAIHNDHVHYDSDDGLYFFDAEESEFNGASNFPPKLAEYSAR